MAWKIFTDDTTRLLEKCLAWQSRRQEIIAGNIANLDTPGYRRKEMNFQEILHRQLQGGPEVRLASSHPAHVRERPPGAAGLVRDTEEAVDLDQEMVQMAENQLSYQASVQMVIKKLDQLRTVVEGDRR